MAILDRVKLRTETDLPDSELQLMIDEANQDVITRFGPHADPANPITIWLEGWREKLVLWRAIDITQPYTITEYMDWGSAGETVYVLQPADFKLWAPYNIVIQRWYGGDSARPRRIWGERVQIVYVPVNDGDQREEVIVKLVVLGIQYDAFKSQTVGDISGETTDYHEERRQLMNTLMPRHGMDIA